MIIYTSEQSSHWYTKEGIPCHSVPYADKKREGELRSTTVADARKLDLVGSVSNILGIIAKPALVDWKVEQAILASLTLPRKPQEAEDAFAKRVVEDMKAQTSEAARKGTEIHKAIEMFLLGKGVTLTDNIRPAIQWLNEEVKEVIAAEKVLVNKKAGYAGTVDLICRLKNGRLCVCDFKTQGPKEGKFTVYPEWSLQLEAYKMAFMEDNFSGEPVDLISIVISSGEPTDLLVHTWPDDPFCARQHAFMAAHTLWKWGKKL